MISGKVKLGILVILTLTGVVVCFTYRDPILDYLVRFYRFAVDREQIKAFVSSCGVFAPLSFMFVQVLQVLFAPVPGEATGFIGGYLFGAGPGFIYSTIALTFGSWVNFSVGRLLGRRYGARIIPAKYLKKFDASIKQRGAIISFVFFILPGFPKDYLSLFLGFSNLSTKVFLIMAGIGRIPGTFMLSLQGAQVYQENYYIFVILFFISVGLVLPVIHYREQIYIWMEKIDKK